MNRVITTILAVAAVSTASASVIRVGMGPKADYTQIGDAVASANDGDRIEVEAGTYGPVTVPNSISRLEIVATAWENGGSQDQTVIDAGFLERCFTARMLDDRAQLEMGKVVLRGFTLIRGNALYKGDGSEGDGRGGGAYGGTLEACKITGCMANHGGGAAYAILRSCIITDCQAVTSYMDSDSSMNGFGGGVFNCFAAGCQIDHCNADCCCGGAYLEESSAGSRAKGIYRVHTSIVVSNTLNSVAADANNVENANMFCRGIARADEVRPEFLIDTGYWDYSFKKDDADGFWVETIDADFNKIRTAYGLYDYAHNPRVAGPAVDIGPIEYTSNEYGILDDDVVLASGGEEFSVTVAPTPKAGVGVRLEFLEPCDWITLAREGLDENASFSLVSVANTTGADRSARVVLSYNDGKGWVRSRKTVEIRQFAAPAAPVRGYGICFGVNDYEEVFNKETKKNEPWLSNLNGSVNDAGHFREMLLRSRICNAEDVVLLTDRNATRANFLKALKDVAAAVAKDDVVFISVSTHAGSTASDPLHYTFCCYDNNGEVDEDDLYEGFAPITAKGGKVIVFLDTCHSSCAFREAKTAVTTRPRTSYFDSNMFPKDGPVAFITAVDFYQNSSDNDNQYEDGAAGGNFTSAFIKSWQQMLSQSSSEFLPSFWNVISDVFKNGFGDGKAWQDVLREPQYFNQKLLMQTAAVAPGGYPALSTDGDAGKAAVPGSTYVGWIRYASGDISSAEFTLGSPSQAKDTKGRVRVKGKIIAFDTGSKVSISGYGYADKDGVITADLQYRNSPFGTVTFSGDCVSGTLDGAVLEGGRVLTRKDAGYGKAAECEGKWNILVSDENEPNESVAVVSLKVAKTGRVTAKAYDGNGTVYSATTKLLVGKLGWCAVPVVLAKRGHDPVTCVCWFSDNGESISVFGGKYKFIDGGICNLNKRSVEHAAARIVISDREQNEYTDAKLKLNSSTELISGSLNIDGDKCTLYGVAGKNCAILGFGFAKGGKRFAFKVE